MRISSKSDYGLRALFDLAQQSGQAPVQSEAIATRQGIPVNYLNQLLIMMRRAGLVESVRGPQGGHRLARPPEQISLRDVLTALDGPLLASEGPREHHSAAVPEDQELIDAVWDELRDRVDGLLGKITLEELCQRKRSREGQVMYYI
jgi:Rrf2 family transcriptional regulator, cysteine metabolism repressor